MATVYLIRHPQPIIAPGICYGQTDLAPEPSALTQLVNELRQQIHKDMLLVTSPLQRCHLVAKALQSEGFPLAHVDQRIQELHFGHWENQAWDQIDRAQIDAWAADRSGFQVPGGESVAMLAERAIQALEHWQRSCEGKTLAFITHAGVIQVLLAHCRHGDFRKMGGQKIEYGSITPVEYAQ
jgi:alpha-ribazole phosphatase